MASFENNWRDADHQIYGTDTYRTLLCSGCRNYYFQIDKTFSEWDYVDHYANGGPRQISPHDYEFFPTPPRRSRPSWLSKLQETDETLASLFQELYSALDQQLLVLAAIGIRTVVDRTTEYLGIDPAEGFDEKLGELEKQGFVGSSERLLLGILTNAGGAAAHRGWKPTELEVFNLTDVLETFVYRALFLRHEVQEMENKTPQKPKRRRK